MDDTGDTYTDENTFTTAQLIRIKQWVVKKSRCKYKTHPCQRMQSPTGIFEETDIILYAQQHSNGLGIPIQPWQSYQVS